MKSTTRSAWTRPLSAVGGALLAFASIWLLGILNARATVQTPPQQLARQVLIRGPESRETVDETTPEQPEPQLPEPEVMEVDLDLPVPEEILPEPLQLDARLPTPSPVRIAVTTAPAAPAAPAPRPQPPAEPPVRSASEVDQPPRESRSNPTPAYPPAKLRSRIEGTVVLRLLIDQSGRVEDVAVVRGDPEFVQAVMQVVWQWRFTPARDRGRPVKVWGIKHVNFTLRR